MNNKKNRNLIIALAVIALLIFAVIIGYVANRKDTPKPVPTIAPTSTTAPTVEPTTEPTEVPTATIAPTNTVAPTEEPTVTAEPTEIPVTTEPTQTPVAEPTVEPTAEPTVEPTTEPTEAPTATPTATVVPTATVAPTATSTPTPTPTSVPKATPTPAVAEGEELIAVYKMGDNVWFKYYDDYELLVVTGTGATWDFASPAERNKAMSMDSNFTKPSTIVIVEGITRIGSYSLAASRKAEKVILPSTLESIGDYAFQQVGKYAENTTWVNLDFTKIKTEPQSFYQANGLDNIEGSSEAMCTPTPTPTPTVTPTPNPKQPRQVGVYQAESNWNNTRAEYYDNGYVYVSADGQAIINDRFFYNYYTGESLEPYGNYFFKYVVVNEGVTKFDDVPNGATEFWLPSTMDITTIKKGAVSVDFTSLRAGDIVHGYYNGRKVTIRFIHDDIIQAQAEAEGLPYEESGSWFMPDVCEVLANMEKILSAEEQTGVITYRPKTVESAYMKNSNAYWSKAALVIEWE